MSLRTLIQIGALAVGLVLFSPLLWPGAGPWPLLAGPGLLAATLGGLLLAAGRPAISRWQIRYEMEVRQTNERLDATLRFLTERAGHVVLEAGDQGLFLEAPAAFDRYVQAQLEQALPQARLSQVSSEENPRPMPGGALYLCLDPLTGDPLGWATAEGDRPHLGSRLIIPAAQRTEAARVRVHMCRGGHLTVQARTAGQAPPPGSWLRLPLSGLVAACFWRRLPIRDELSAGLQPSLLWPATKGRIVYASRSRLVELALPDGHRADGDRHLGQAADGQPLTLSRSRPLRTYGAPASFLVRQAVEDLAAGRAVVVVSPQRRVLNLIQRQAQAPTSWLDLENSRSSAHLAVVAADEWAGHDVEGIVGLTEAFLGSLPTMHAAGKPGGLDLHLPAVRTLVHHLVRILAASAQATGHDFAFTDLYAISQSTQTLRAFLADLQSLVRGLDAETRAGIGCLAEQLESDAGYVQVITVLSMLRALLSPLRNGAVHMLCQPPFANANQILGRGRLLLVPLTGADLPEDDRFLAAMLDLVLSRVLAAGGDGLGLALHLHEPHRFYHDGGRHWLEVARHDARLSLFVDVQDPGKHAVQPEAEGGNLVFRCSAAVASSLIDAWGLSCTAADLAELPDGTAVARLPGLPGMVTLNVGDDL